MSQYVVTHTPQESPPNFSEASRTRYNERRIDFFGCWNYSLARRFRVNCIDFPKDLSENKQEWIHTNVHVLWLFLYCNLRLKHVDEASIALLKKVYDN